MSRVHGPAGELLALCSHLPRCERKACAEGGKRPPIATFTTGRGGEYLCGHCARRRRPDELRELPYRRVLRWLLRAIAAGQVLDGGGKTLTIVSPDGALADVAAVLDADDDVTTPNPKER
jgi:hypothetical protein